MGYSNARILSDIGKQAVALFTFNDYQVDTACLFEVNQLLLSEVIYSIRSKPYQSNSIL